RRLVPEDAGSPPRPDFRLPVPEDGGPESSTILTSLSTAMLKVRSPPSATRRTSLSLPGLGEGDLGPGVLGPGDLGPLFLGSLWDPARPGEDPLRTSRPISTWSSPGSSVNSKTSSSGAFLGVGDLGPAALGRGEFPGLAGGTSPRGRSGSLRM